MGTFSSILGARVYVGIEGGIKGVPGNSSIPFC